MHAHGLDLHTRVVVVEFTVYNAMLDRVCHVRAAAELTKAGGVVPQFSFQTVSVWERVIGGVFCSFGLIS